MRRAREIVVAKVARAVHHQARIAGDAADHRGISRSGVGRVFLHRDPSAESGLPLRAGARDEARGDLRFLVEQQRVDPAVVVGARETAAVARPDRLLVVGAQVRGPPGVAGGVERVRGSPADRIGVREARPAVAGARLFRREEGHHRRGILAGTHRFFGPAPHSRSIGPIGIGDQERGIIREAVAAALAKPPPLVERVSDAWQRRRRRGLGEARHIAPSSTARSPAKPAPVQQDATCWTYCRPAPYRPVNAANPSTENSRFER